jgi:hypothetical protein
MRKLLWIASVFALLVPGNLRADTFIFEGGVLTSQKLFVSSGTNPDATSGWNPGAVPTVRAEYWIHRPDTFDFDFGLTLAPLIFGASDTLTSDITVSGVTLPKGAFTGLNFNFSNLRLSGNYPVLRWNERRSSLRLGVTGVFNYARFEFTSQDLRAVETDLLAVPIVRVDLTQAIGGENAFVIHGDFLPLSPSLDTGFFDFFLGLKFKRFESGLRFFWGGFIDQDSPQTSNATFFSSMTIRAVF